MTRKTILYIACSIDGYIAKPNDDLQFLSAFEKEGEDYGYNAFVDSVDTVIMGRRTYDWVMARVAAFPNAHKKTYIISRRKTGTEGNVSFYNGSLSTLVSSLKLQEGKNIFIDGGAEIVNELLKEQLIDDMIVSIIPVLLGDGIRLFKDGRPEQKSELISVQNYDTGLLQLHYRNIKNQ